MVEQNESNRRFPALYVALVAMFVLLVGGLFRMQVLEGGNYRAQAQENRQRLLYTKPNRGIIYDRTGKRLVVNNPSYSVVALPSDLPDFNCVTKQLEDDTVFKELAKKLGTLDVIAIRPAELSTEDIGKAANLLSVPLRIENKPLKTGITEIKEASPESQNLFALRKDIPADVAEAIRVHLKEMPGVYVYNELQFNFLTRFSKCIAPVVVARSLSYPDQVQQVEAAQAEMPGISVAPEPVRAYPEGALFGHIVGYVGPISREAYDAAQQSYEPDDKVGQTGIEAGLEEYLRGEKGVAQVMVNSQEQIISTIASKEPITGNSVMLTLDVDLQKQVAQALQDGITQAKSKAGVAIVMRVDNGQVLSMVSLPSYDNNLFAQGITQADFDRLNNDPTLPMFHRAIGGAYPPGSTYKMITAAAALQENVLTPETRYYCPGFIEVPYTWSEATRNPFRDWKQAGHGTLDIVQALTVSSDVFFYIAAGPRQEDRRIRQSDGSEQIVWTRYYTPDAKKPTEFDGLGIERLSRYADAFGLGKKTGIEIPGEVSGVAPDPNWKLRLDANNPWSLGDTLVTAIGQGYNLVTPLQLVNVTAAVANGGTLYQPQVVLRVDDWSGKTVRAFEPREIGKVPVSPENLAIVREGMRQSVANKEKGTAHRISLKSIEVAGKTGTAEIGEVLRVENGKEIRASHAWFTAFAPYDKPEIAVLVLLEAGEESLEGATYAVPVTDAILKAYFKANE
jgi:penicillin-binding protein 2